jgi:hypothetical protein
MLRHVTLVRTDVSEELSASIRFLRRVRRLLVTANVPSSPILVTLMMEALRSSETSVLTRATLRHIPEGDILQFLLNAVRTTGSDSSTLNAGNSYPESAWFDSQTGRRFLLRFFSSPADQ